MQYAFEDFEKLCHITEKDLVVDEQTGEVYCTIHCFRVTQSGVWVIKPDRFNSTEDCRLRLVLANGNYNKPYLKFPCSRAQFKKLLATDELSQRVVPAQDGVEMTAAWVSDYLDQLLGNETPSGKKKWRHPDANLTEAVKKLYIQLREAGETYCLRPGKVREFIREMGMAIKKGDRNYSAYFAERILGIENVKTKPVIRVADRIGSNRVGVSYCQNAVSKRLSGLRKSMPLL